MTEKSENVGKIGESVVALYMKNKGFTILARNYWKKWGEIDVIAESDGVVHFIEVKTVSRENLDFSGDNWAPEENVHPKKLKRLARAIQSYILEENFKDNQKWQIDVAGVLLNLDDKKARIRMTENVVL